MTNGNFFHLCMYLSIIFFASRSGSNFGNIKTLSTAAQLVLQFVKKTSKFIFLYSSYFLESRSFVYPKNKDKYIILFWHVSRSTLEKKAISSRSSSINRSVRHIIERKYTTLTQNRSMKLNNDLCHLFAFEKPFYIF